MCGIAMILAPGRPDLLSAIGGMVSAVRHRGPDDEGVVAFSGETLAPTTYGGPDTPGSVYGHEVRFAPSARFEDIVPPETVLVLGHRRLSIVELSPAGHQPMCTSDGQYWIVYNGEVYNYIELRTELEAAGARFISRSDTEVILEAYRRWGRESLHRFNGMFAFVLIDRRAGHLFIARDRFGVKPLYIWQFADGAIAVASEIKQFTAIPGWEARLHGQLAYDFLNWGVLDHTVGTLFDGVTQLRGGEFLELDLRVRPRQLLLTQWYRLPMGAPTKSPCMKAEFHSLLEDAVRLRLRADVPVGSCLSGGLDSSSIVCLMSRLLREQRAYGLQRTFSARSDIERFDEGKFIEAVVDGTGVHPAHVYPQPEDLFQATDALIRHQDEPFGSSSIYAQWAVFKLAASSGVKVMLDGQGADETLAGYPTFFGAHYVRRLLSSGPSAMWREMRTGRAVHAQPWLWIAKQIANCLLPDWVRQPLRALTGEAVARSRWLDLDRLGAKPRDPTLNEAGRRPRSIFEMSLEQLTRTSLPMLLHWEDRDSMAHSVEARLPFLDYRVVERLLTLPDDFKIRQGVTKHVLREAMHGELPEIVRSRQDKMGFVTAEEVWLREQHADRFREMLSTSIEASQGIIRGEAMLQQLDKMIAGQRHFSHAPWRAITFGRWMSLFNVRL